MLERAGGKKRGRVTGAKKIKTKDRIVNYNKTRRRREENER